MNNKLKYEFKINALLEISQKINKDFNEKELYDLYCSKLESLIQLNSVALFVYELQWELKVHFGLEEDLKKYKSSILKFSKFQFLDDEKYADWPFNVIFPIFYRGKKIAVLCLKYDDINSEGEELPFVRALTNMMMVALENQWMIRKEMKQKELEKELLIAGEVQSMLVPRELPQSKNIEMSSTYIPHRKIGGDYFDCIQKSDHEYFLCIADVSGKGVPAALLMSNFQATLRALVLENLPLKEIVEKVNLSISKITGGERFITAFFAIYDDIKREINYINAGHNPPFFLDKEKHTFQKLTEGTTLLGPFEKLPFLKEGNIKLFDYTLLFMYTDGLVEIFDSYGKEFGEVGLYHFLKTEETHSLSEMHEALLDLILSYSSTGGYQDDITILSCKFRF